ncbi:hypothetical protein [Pseudobacteriovorax antillogorgiicola]|uniref:Uncharacterized protein n=1 Tax=Pseudobacteriovorax antillogorgiicola TaxID=1513793 RepID=A0A1Y6CZ89_9BACT|nr:hypothetical protein [Pseudobacteriovorax antillogorgiicola]TCS40844.1 hypothetical protein EDD56_1537 [Pseudobacteriovorax antillogorgiicola]SMF84307.1 hypothetical protein SAMN06296036_1538 [Pseudobacteriovorax antillogorgiicola]
MKLFDLLGDLDEASLISVFYNSWQKFEERKNSYFSSKDIVVANFSSSLHPNLEFDFILEVIEAAHLLLDRVLKNDELSLAQRKIRHSIDFLEQKGSNRILKFLEAEKALFPEIDVGVLERYHEAYLALKAQSSKTISGKPLDGATIKNILETRGRSLLVRMGFEALLRKYPLEVVEANSNDGWMVLVMHGREAQNLRSD